ncbi:hypothetical protein [Bacillus sp. N1-1]|uniref:hypothetical protein n=1 Tax=Bacillus sp. N1-1 TaxID=2682541 RepID=UPI0013173289|nr:hypothetical protein [Bacillus sp. N1-1]QHA91440.1 hypothetical protein GNK04_08415 [Bacillus sp. N1-1]
MKLQFLKLRSRITPTIWFISVVIFALFLTFVLPQVSNKSYEITQTLNPLMAHSFTLRRSSMTLQKHMEKPGEAITLKNALVLTLSGRLCIGSF